MNTRTKMKNSMKATNTRTIPTIILSMLLGTGAVFAACQACITVTAYVGLECMYECPDMQGCEEADMSSCSFNDDPEAILRVVCTLFAGGANCSPTAEGFYMPCDSDFNPFCETGQ